MTRLKSKLLSLNTPKPAHLKTKVYSPANCEQLLIPIRTDKMARVVGSLAERIKVPSSVLETSEAMQDIKQEHELDPQIVRNAVLVSNDLKLSLMAPEDLREYAGLTTTTITCRQKITLASASIELIRWALEGTFGGVLDLTVSPNDAKNGKMNGAGASETKEEQEEADEELPRPITTSLLVMDTVTVHHRRGGEITVEWEGNMMNDGIADAVMAVLLSVESSPAAVRQSSKLHAYAHGHSREHEKAHTNGDSAKESKTLRNPHVATTDPAEKLARVLMFLEAQFGADNVEPTIGNDVKDGNVKVEPTDEKSLAMLPVPQLQIKVDKHVATIRLEDLHVDCANNVLRDRVKAVIERSVECVAPLWQAAF